MKYTLTNTPQAITETKGEIENLSVRHTILLAAGTTEPTGDAATITVRPGESYPYKTAIGEFLYAWLLNPKEGETLEVSVVNFPVEGEGGEGVDLIALEEKTRINTEQIQNCYSVLGTKANPLVGFISLEDGAFWKVQQDGQLSQNYGTCFGSNKGMSGVMDKTNGKIHIGEGYTNYAGSNDINGTGWKIRTGATLTYTDLGNGWFNLKGTRPATTGLTLECPLNMLSHEGENCLTSVTIRNKKDDVNVDFRNRGTSDSVRVYPSEEKKCVTFGVLTTSADRLYLSFDANADLTYDIDIKMDLLVTLSSIELPFVQKTAPSGRFVIDEKYTSRTHSFVGIGFYKTKSQAATITLTSDIKYYNGEYITFGNVVLPQYTDFIFSNSYSRLLDYDGKDFHLEIRNKGLVRDGGISLVYEDSTSSPVKNFQVFAIYKGDLGESGLMEERAKIKNGKYIIPQKFVGTPHNIPYMPRKCDADGLTYETVEVDTNRDLEVLEKETRWEILKLSDDTVSYASVKKVNDVWTINGALDNVSGMLRVQYPSKIRGM